MGDSVLFAVESGEKKTLLGENRSQKRFFFAKLVWHTAPASRQCFMKRHFAEGQRRDLRLRMPAIVRKMQRRRCDGW